tara:strand:+ start:763 stop:1572 length:810 start_codon:yes stop_codon:yes gene_type:complete
MVFTKKEIVALAISILVMGLALGFNDKQEVFVFSYFIYNLFIMTLMVGVAFVVHQLGHKLVAYMSGFKTEYKIWGLQTLRWWPLHERWSIKRTPQFPKVVTIGKKQITIESLPVGIILAVLVTVVSNGWAFFLAVGQYNLLIERASRVGKKFVEVTDFEEAKIALAGPMANILLMVIASLFNQYGTFDNFILINSALALFYMIPVSQLDGAKVLFSSRIMYVFGLLFIIFMVVLIHFISVIPLLIISGLFAFIGGAVYFYYSYYQGKIY